MEKTPKDSKFYDFLALFWRSNPQVVNERHHERWVNGLCLACQRILVCHGSMGRPIRFLLAFSLNTVQSTCYQRALSWIFLRRKKRDVETEA